MKNRYGLLALLVGVSLLSGCGSYDTDTETIRADESQSIEEELAAFENMPEFSLTVNEMAEILKADDKLSLKDEETLCIFQDQKEQMEIQLGSWDSPMTEIYFTIHEKQPMDNPTVRKTFFPVLDEIFAALDQTVDQDTIESQIRKIKTKDQSDDFQYSDSIKLFVGRVGDDFDFRIYPLSDTEK